MSNVPSHSRTRRTHRRTFAAGEIGRRHSHTYDGYEGPITGAQEVYEDATMDPVPPEPVVYPEGSIPPSAVDTRAPAAPTGLGLTSNVGTDADGHAVLRLVATLTHPTTNSDGTGLTDLFASYVEITAENDGAAENPQPIWTNALVLLIASDTTTGAVEGVRGLTQYWARAYSTDIFGNRSAMSSTATHTTTRDNDAPGQPQSVSMSPGFKGFGVHWTASSAPDLMFYELRYAVDDGSGTSPDEEQWVTLHVRTNTVWVDNLTIGVKYWSQVRAVDFSGNVVTSAGDVTAVDYLAFPEAGWTGLLSATPVAVGAADVAFNSVITNILSANMIDAATIQTGLLKVSVGAAGMADGIEIWNAAGTLRLGYWNENGLYIGDNTDGLPTDLSAIDYVRVTNAGLTVYLNGVATSAITPDGINASAINFGTLPGGHNLLQNSSFELAEFATAASTETWDVQANWTATELSNTNATNGANSVTQTASTY